MSYGAQVKFGFARQAAGGSGSAATDAGSYHGFPQTSEDLGLEKDELVSQNMIGRFEEGAVYDGINRVLGTVNFELTPRSINCALAMVVNHAPVSVTSASIRTLTWLPNTVDYDATYVKAPWSGYKQFTDSNSAEHFYDLQPSQLDITVANGQFSTGRMAITGGARIATGTGSKNIIPSAADAGVLFPWNVASISLGGSGLGQNSEITVSLNEQIEALYTNNASLAPYKYTRSGFRQVTVSGRLYMTDRAQLNQFSDSTQARLVITLINTRTAIQSGYYNTFQIDVPQMKFTQYKPTASGPGEVSVDFQARGVIDPTSFYSIQFVTVTTWQASF